jgi:hypothetical protein
MQEDHETSSATPEKSLFLDFLMYITYDYLCRNKPCRDARQNPLKVVL